MNEAFLLVLSFWAAAVVAVAATIGTWVAVHRFVERPHSGGRRRTAVALGVTIAVGLALVAAGVARGEAADLGRLAVEGPVHAALVYVTAGMWAELRGVVAPGWMLRPAVLVRAILARMGGAR